MYSFIYYFYAMIVYIDMEDHSKDKACGFEQKLANRLIFLKVQMCSPSRFARYYSSGGVRKLEAVTEEDFMDDKREKYLIDSCTEWAEVKEYLK